MPYSDKTYFVNKINNDELDKLTNSDEQILNEAIKSADSLIDSYLKNVVSSLPFENAPYIIQQCSYDLAIFYLHDRIQYSEIPQWVKDKYNSAIDFLTKAAKGIVSLDFDNNSDQYSDNINYFGNETIMNRGSF